MLHFSKLKKRHKKLCDIVDDLKEKQVMIGDVRYYYGGTYRVLDIIDNVVCIKKFNNQSDNWDVSIVANDKLIERKS